MATEVGESEPIPEILHSVETGTSESSKGKTIIEAPLKETTLQYVTNVSAKLENEGCLTSNGNKDDAAKKFVPEESPNMNEMDAEKNTYDEVTKFDITEVSEAQVRDKEQKLEDEHVEIEAKTGSFGNERINGIDSTQEPLEITAEESPLDAVAIELEAEKLERLKEDKQVQIEAKTGSLNDERSFEIISVAETLKSSEPAGNQTEGGKLEGPFDAVPKDSESLNFKREEDDKNVETEAETGGLGDERASKDIDSIYVRDPSEEESTQESLQTDPRQNLQPAEDDPGGDKLENIKAIPNEPKEENLQQITEEKHDNVEAETGTFNEEITNDSPNIEDEDKFEPAEYKPEGCELATDTDVVPIELEEKNLERACQDEHVKIELETENINDQSSNEIVSVSEPSEEETMQQPHETISEGDIDHAGDKPEGEKLESPLEPVSKQPDAENLDRVEEENKHDAQNGSLNDKICNEIDHLSLVESAEEEITQDPPKIMTEDDPELAKDEPEDAKLENTLDAILQELENTLDAVLQEPEAEKLKRVEEDKLIADIESTEGERANDINSVSFTEAEDTQGSLGRMTEETPEPAPEGGKLESSLDEFPNQTEAEKLEIIKEKHVEIEAETGSFSDERANDIDSMYITEPLEKLNAQEQLESMTEEDLVLAEDESKGEKPLEALLDEPEGITPASTLPHSVPNFSETTSQHETEKISEERECEVGLVLEEIKGGTNSENLNSESDKKDKEVKNEDHQNDAVCEESPISASEDQSDKVTTISTDDTKDNDLNGITSRKLELASELIPEQKSEVTEIETKDIKLEHSPHDENSYKNTETNELSKEGEAVNEVAEDSIGTDAIEETTEEASGMLEDSKKVTSEIPEMELNDYEGKEKCETNLNNSVDGSPSSHELLDETKDVEVGKTTKVDDETNQSTDKEAYDTECEQHYQIINAKGDVEVDDDKQNGEVEELEFVKELVPRDDNQEGLRELEVTDDTIHDDNLDTVIPESVGDTCNLAPDDAEEAQNKVIQDGDTKNEIIVEELSILKVNKSAVTVETPVSEDVIQVIKADVYECHAYEEKGEHKENTSASLLLEKSVHNEDEKTKEVLDDLTVTSALSDEAAYGQGDQRQQATEEDNRARDGNPNEENDKTVIQNIESAVEELKNNGGRIISDDNRPEIIALNETKEGKNRHEKEADSSNEEKDHDELNEVVVCENDKISEEAESKGGEACTSSLTSQEIEDGELHKTDEIIIEEKQEILELENNEGEEISNRDTSSSEPNVVESKHLSLQTLKKEEANQEINDTNEEVLEAEQSDIIIAQIEKIAEEIEVLNTKVTEDVGQEMANPTEGIEKRKVFEEEATEIKKLAVKTVPRDEDEETKQEVGEKFSKISDYWPGLYKEETSNANAMTIECSKEILTGTDRSPCKINEKGEEVQCAVKASEDTICNGGEKLDGTVNSSMKPIEDKESSREVVIETEDDDKASNENDESDNLPVSHFLMKHILREQADNLDRIGDEKYEDPTNKQNEEGKENEMNILKQEEVPIKESMIPETIPEDEAKPENFKNMSESVQEELDHDVKEKPELLVSKDDASKLFEVTTHSSMDDSVELKSKEQSIPDSEVNIEEHKYPNVVQDEKNHSTIVEREMTEMETHKENESQHQYDDIFQKEDGEESKEFHQEIEKVESESQSTKDGSKIEDIFEFESEVNNGESGEEKQQGGEESKFNIKKVDSERQSSKDDGEIEEILEIESEVNKQENEKKQEGGEESKEFQQDIKKVEFKGQSTKTDCKIEEILELESEVTKEESEDEKHEVEIKGQREVEELEQPETQNNGEMELKKEREEEYEPDPSTQTSELETTQKCVPTSKTFESSAVEDLDCEEEKEDVMDGNQGQNLKNTKVEEDKTDEEKYENEDDSQEPEESSNKETIVVEAREVELKPTHKKSHNILSGVGSKVKHSFAKVKKAITGKSSHTKTLSAK